MVCSFFIPKKKGVRKIATTGIWKIEKRLDNVIDYTTNIEKTINSDYGKDIITVFPIITIDSLFKISSISYYII